MYGRVRSGRQGSIDRRFLFRGDLILVGQNPLDRKGAIGALEVIWRPARRDRHTRHWRNGRRKGLKRNILADRAVGLDLREKLPV